MRGLPLLLLSVLLLTGCDLFGSDDDDDPRLITTGVVVGNGGNFGDQNGFVTVYDPATGTTADMANLSGFVNSIAVRGTRVYALLNTFSTGRIDVLDLDLDLDQAARVAQIQDVPIPRYMDFLNDTKAYVTNLNFAGKGFVNVLDLTTNTVVGDPIEVDFSPAGILVVGDEVFVANSGNSGAGTTLSIINTATDTVSRSIDLGCDGPTEIMLDAEEELIVVCHGKTVFNDDFTEVLERTNGQVVFVDAASRSVTGRIQLNVQVGSTNGSQAATYSAEAEEAYILNPGDNQVFRIDTATNTLAATIAVPEAADLTGLSGLAYDADQERLYIGRLAQAGGFASFTDAGAVVVLDRDGTQIDRFPAGPAPSYVALRQETE